jgi:hypothetical protein
MGLASARGKKEERVEGDSLDRLGGGDLRRSRWDLEHAFRAVKSHWASSKDAENRTTKPA